MCILEAWPSESIVPWTPGTHEGEGPMHYLYGLRTGSPARLVATFDSEEQLKAYLRWATVSRHDGVCQFEKGSVAGRIPRKPPSPTSRSRTTIPAPSITTRPRACSDGP